MLVAGRVQATQALWPLIGFLWAAAVVRVALMPAAVASAVTPELTTSPRIPIKASHVDWVPPPLLFQLVTNAHPVRLVEE